MAKVVALTAYRVQAGRRESVTLDSNTLNFLTLDGQEVNGFVITIVQQFHNMFLQQRAPG